MVRFFCTSVLLTSICVSSGFAQLLSQPDEVFGQSPEISAVKSSAGAPKMATHQNNRGKWELDTTKLPTLKELENTYKDPMPIYGLYLDGNLYLQYRKDIKDVGFSTFRIGGGGHSQKTLDDCIAAMIDDGLRPMIVMGAKKRDEFDSDEAYIANALEQFRAKVKRYGPNGDFFKEKHRVPYKPVMHFQVLNEPNFQYMYKGDGTNAMIPIRHALYAKLLPATYKMIKSEWPEVQVVGWTCGGAAAQDSYFVDNAIKINPEMAQCFDIFSTHPYVSPVPPETSAVQGWGKYSIAGQLKKVRDRFASAGRPASKLPVWYTEGGWKLKKADGGMSDSGEIEKYLHAAYYVRYYAMGIRLGVNCIMPMYIVDADGFNGGIFNRTAHWQRDNKNPMRPVAYAIKNMIQLMPNPRLKTIISDGKDGYYCYEIINDKQSYESASTIMAWNVKAGVKEVKIPVKFTRTTITDMLGKTQPAKIVDGKVTVKVGPYPIYITLK